MRIGATADLHGFLPEVPADLDLLLIAGDIGVRADYHLETFPGVDRTLADFDEWLDSLDCPVIGVAGNHDFGFQGHPGSVHARNLNWTYLCDETTEFDGLVIHGSPWTPTYGPWAFMRDDENLTPAWDLIPDNVDILITHGPPHGVMDIGHGGNLAGSKTLAARLADIAPKLHVFGHIHGSRGERYEPECCGQPDYPAECCGSYLPTGECCSNPVPGDPECCGQPVPGRIAANVAFVDEQYLPLDIFTWDI